MPLSFSHARGLRARLVVLSDRRPAPGAARTELEAAIEAAIREHDGLWLVRYANVADGSGALEASDDRERWSVLESLPGQPSSADDWTDYVLANASYAERIIEVVSPDGTVWIIGHRWLLVAHELRKHGHRGPIGLWLDVPFPPPARLEALPWHASVMAALCELDLIGFHTPECAASFEACRVRAGRQRPGIGVFPTHAGSPAHADPAAWVMGFLTQLGSAARRQPRRRFIE